ncbi:MAG: ATP-binding protein [Actinomycetaceae bacterium]|nr:ATP-binding protein [Actinomycetaceae bacterium]
MFSSGVERALNLPPDEAVKELAALPETQWFERKSGKVAAADLSKPIVAMANAEGGVIAVGLRSGEVEPVSDNADNQIRQAAIDFTRPQVRTQVAEINSSSGRVLILRVAPGDQVHETHKGECYQRIGDESRRLTFSQRQELQWDRGVANFSARPVEGVNVDDLDSKQLTQYQRNLGSSSVERALEARDLLTVNGQVTIAAYLLFANRPQQLFPNAYVRVIKYLDNDRGTGSALQIEDGCDLRCEGSLPEQIEQAKKAISQFLPRRRGLGASGRFESLPIIPQDAWLEGLVNAVIHRSYSISGDHIRVEIFPNRVEITSPGRFPGLSNPASPETISRNARNPRIARVCAEFGFAQELGEGIRRIFNEMRKMGLTDPMYQQTPEAVRLTLSASNTVPSQILDQVGGSGKLILDALRQAQRPLGTGQIVEIVGLARPTVLRHLRRLAEVDLVYREGASPKDPRATWSLK